MHILIVQARVKAEFIDAFKQATAVNAASSAKEPGVARFDFLQQQDDPQEFVLYEVYRDPSAPAKHCVPREEHINDVAKEPRVYIV